MRFILLILLLIALGSLGFGVLVLAKSPRSLGERVFVALVAGAIGCTPLVLFLIALASWPGGN